MRKHHTMLCTYPVGCLCGASEFNNLMDQLFRQEQELATLRFRLNGFDGYTCRKVRVAEEIEKGTE